MDEVFICLNPINYKLSFTNLQADIYQQMDCSNQAIKGQMCLVNKDSFLYVLTPLRVELLERFLPLCRQAIKLILFFFFFLFFFFNFNYNMRNGLQGIKQQQRGGQPINIAKTEEKVQTNKETTDDIGFVSFMIQKEP